MPNYWLAFKAHRDEKWVRTIESPLDKQNHKNRECRPPFAGKVKVYHWEENVDQKHIHTSITQKAREDCFDVYRYQLFYDLRYNE